MLPAAEVPDAFVPNAYAPPDEMHHDRRPDKTIAHQAPIATNSNRNETKTGNVATRCGHMGQHNLAPLPNKSWRADWVPVIVTPIRRPRKQKLTRRWRLSVGWAIRGELRDQSIRAGKRGLHAAWICLAQFPYLDSLHLGISPVSVAATYARAAPVSSAQLRNRY